MGLHKEQIRRNFMRVKTDIDIDKPLSADLRWKNSEEEESWAELKYERLSIFFYGCGRLGHTSTSCKEEVMMSEIEVDSPKYGPRMTGTSPRGKNFPIPC